MNKYIPHKISVPIKISAQGYNDTIVNINIEDNTTLTQDIYLSPCSTSLSSYENSIEDVIIFPNPCNEKLFLRNNNFFAYIISNFQRNNLLKQRINKSNEIDVSELSAGVYFLTLYGQDETRTLIFIKQ